MNRRDLFKFAFGAAATAALKPLEKLVPKPKTYSTYLYPKDFIAGLEKCGICKPLPEVDPAKTIRFVSYNVQYTMGPPPPNLNLYVKRIQVPENSDDLSSTLLVL